MIRRLLFLAVIALVFHSCQSSETPTPERPHLPWVFRSVLDGQPRMLTVALHDDLWLAYSTENAALVKAWRGSVNLDGAVYTTVHGPQPSSLGDRWLESSIEQPWHVLREGQEVPVSVQYRGHHFVEEQVWIKYELLLEDGTTISIKEQPEYYTNEYGQTGLSRTFETSEVPAGVQIVMSTQYASLPTAGALKTNGEWLDQSSENAGNTKMANIVVDGGLGLISNGSTTLNAFFTARPGIKNQNRVAGAEEEERRPLGFRLIARSDCRSCHNTYRSGLQKKH